MYTTFRRYRIGDRVTRYTFVNVYKDGTVDDVESWTVPTIGPEACALTARLDRRSYQENDRLELEAEHRLRDCGLPNGQERRDIFDEYAFIRDHRADGIRDCRI